MQKQIHLVSSIQRTAKFDQDIFVAKFLAMQTGAREGFKCEKLKFVCHLVGFWQKVIWWTVLRPKIMTIQQNLGERARPRAQPTGALAGWQ